MGHSWISVTNIQVVIKYFEIQNIFDVIAFQDIWHSNVMTIRVLSHISQLSAMAICDNSTQWNLVRWVWKLVIIIQIKHCVQHIIPFMCMIGIDHVSTIQHKMFNTIYEYPLNV